MNDRHLLGYRWHDGAPYLILRASPAGGEIERRPLSGVLSLRLDVRRYCLGPSQGASPESRSPCPDVADLTGTRRRLCHRCERRWTFRHWLAFDGTEAGRERLPPDIQALCARPYVVYLAGFGASAIKVGISAEGRKEERLLEQGALLGAVIARVDGMSARSLELAIAKLGYPERVRVGSKPATFVSAQALDELRSRLWSSLHDLRVRLPSEQVANLQEPELFDLTPFYGIRALPEEPIAIQVEPGRDVVGEVVAVRGGSVALATGSSLLAFHVRRLEGHLVELDLVA
ncbi:MAG: DUF2797 domain-containing protein, partial [Chloroflexi bacterium]|nr:DUF2797 domain-containing protein [Chloroflexota bacterium]